MSLLKPENFLHVEKALLAFSGGADSTALFYSLLQNNINFDIAIVHYGLRVQADEELISAQNLAKKYNLKCHFLHVEKIDKNFEFTARKKRYDFFEDLIKEFQYTHLLTAHHLQDRLEWMLMQFTKGAGVAELLGMNEIEKRGNHTLLRPLIQTTKDEILNYLNKNDYTWFEDESNKEEKYRRNYFRHNIVNELIKDNIEGIKKSFNYLEEDIKALIKETKIYNIDELSMFKSTTDKRSDIYHIDKILKQKGYILTAPLRQELKVSNELIVGRKFLVILDKNFYYIAPFIKEVMDKEFKEECRKLQIPNKLRPYLFKSPSAFILYAKFIPCDI